MSNYISARKTGFIAGIGLAAALLGTPMATASATTTETDHLQGRLGVSMELRNMSTVDTIKVKDRDTGREVSLAPGEKATFSEHFHAAVDELELKTWKSGDGDEIDAANPTFSWPNVTIDGDNENFSTGETKTFLSDAGTRYKVTRNNDSGEYKTFYTEITPGHSF